MTIGEGEGKLLKKFPALLNTIIKYPVSSTQVHPDSGNIREKKMGYFLADEKIFEEITQETKTGNCRHPLTYCFTR